MTYNLGRRVDTLLVRKVNLKVSLKIEKSELITLVQLQELAERRVRKDLTLVRYILEIMSLAVSIDSLSDLSASN